MTFSCFQGIGYTLNIQAVMKTMKTFKQLQLSPFVKAQKMDDDCERGMFRAYNILACLNKNKSVSTKIPSKQQLVVCMFICVMYVTNYR